MLLRNGAANENENGPGICAMTTSAASDSVPTTVIRRSMRRNLLIQCSPMTAFNRAPEKPLPCVSIGPTTLRRIAGHAESDAPAECCGILLGRHTGTRVIVTVPVPSTNVTTGNLHRSYTAAPNLVLHTLLTRGVHKATIPSRDRKRADQRAITGVSSKRLGRYSSHKDANQIVGFYHSHPSGSAAPSPLDRRLAWPAMVYLILAIRHGRVTRVMAWWKHRQHDTPAQSRAHALYRGISSSECPSASFRGER